MQFGSSIKRTTFGVFILNGLSSILGFFREAYIAFQFGATGLTDSYYVATVVPDMLASVISVALSNSIIPVLRKEKRVSRESAIRIVSAVCILSAIVLLIMSFCVFLVKGEIVELLSPGFSVYQHAVSARMLGIMSLAVLFSGLSGLLTGIHNANDKFRAPAIIGLSYNSLLLVTTFLLVSRTGIDSLAYGFLIGMFGKFAIQCFPYMKTVVFTVRPNFRHRAIRDMCVLMIPIMISSGLGTINLIVDRILASGLPQGQISDLNFAAKLGLLPVSLIAGSLATTVYTRFVTHVLDSDHQRLRETLVKALAWVLFLGICIGCVMIVYATDIISILFRHGAFRDNDVSITRLPLMVYGISMCFYLAQPILARYLFANAQNRFVAISSLTSVSTNIIVSISAVHHNMGIMGLALGNAVSQVSAVVLTMIFVCLKTRWSLGTLLYDIVSRGLIPAIAFVVPIAVVSAVFIEPSEHEFIVCSIRTLTGVTAGILGLLFYSMISKNNMVCSVVYNSSIQISRKFLSAITTNK
jgi:putative peptidoglycan lipid II flippase